MKPKNFPARKLVRQIEADQRAAGIIEPIDRLAIEEARNVRTKKNRKSK